MYRAMERITSADLTQHSADRFYVARGPRPGRHEGWLEPGDAEKYDALRALGDHPSQAAVERILGTPAWTHVRCALCGRLKTEAVRLDLYDTRFDLCSECLEAAMRLIHRDAEVHSLADVAMGTTLGPGTRIWAYAVIGPRVTIGPDCIIGAASHIMRDARLGTQVRLQSHCFICEEAVIGDRVFCGVGVILSADKYPAVGKTDYQANPPIIEDDVNIGSGAVILPGVRLGKGCTVGAGAVVTRRVEAGQTVIGNPARPLRAHRPAALADHLGIDEDTYQQVCLRQESRAHEPHRHDGRQ